MSSTQENIAPPTATGAELAEKPLPVQQSAEKGEHTEAATAAPVKDFEKMSLFLEKTEQEATETGAATPAPTGPAAATIASSTSPEPVWPESPADHPLNQFFDAFEALVTETGHNEVYGITLSRDKPFHTKLILQKFLRANSNDLQKAKEQLRDTLKWRKEFDPVAAAEAVYEKERFEGLGYVMELENVPESANGKDVVTFNIYGAVKDNKKTFGDLEGLVV
jgi:hypothetical protein